MTSQKKYKFLLILQARTESRRLPKKVLKKLSSQELITVILKRLKKSKLIDKIVVATCKDKYYKNLIKIVKKNKIDFFIGSKKNVLKRYYDASNRFNAKNIIRITADCPLVDWKMIDKMILKFKKNKSDYYSNTLKRTYPDGLDIEIFTKKALDYAYKFSKNSFQKEHVTNFIIQNKKFKKSFLSQKKNFGNLRFTIDEKKDFKFFQKVFNYFYPNIFFSWKEVIKLNINFNLNK